MRWSKRPDERTARLLSGKMALFDIFRPINCHRRNHAYPTLSLAERQSERALTLTLSRRERGP